MSEIKVQKIEVGTLIDYYLKELGFESTLAHHLEAGREEIPVSTVLRVLLQNIMMSTSPLYKLSDWLLDYSDGMGEFGAIANKFNDERLGRSLDRLYEADRSSLMAELSGKAVELHNLETEKIHNDTTTVSFTGSKYDEQEAAGVKLARGYNKDGKPDCVQIVFGLNVTADGHVPLLSQLYDGNKTDDTTHKVNWDALKDFLKKADFVYIADSKLSTTENLEYIDGESGKFISILPKTRKEVGQMYDNLGLGQTPSQEWQPIHQTVNSRKKGEVTTYRSYEGDKSKEGFRIIWIHSSAKAVQDAAITSNRIDKAAKELKELSSKLNKYNLKTKASITDKVHKILKTSEPLFNIELTENQETISQKVGRGRPGANTKYTQKQVTTYQLNWSLNQQVIESKAKTNGIFPLITNTDLPAEQVLKTYKDQPYLEKRFSSR